MSAAKYSWTLYASHIYMQKKPPSTLSLIKSAKILLKLQISFFNVIKNKQFYANGNTAGYHPQLELEWLIFLQ